MSITWNFDLNYHLDLTSKVKHIYAKYICISCKKFTSGEQAGGLFKDVTDEMKKHADNLTPSQFGEANDKINRKQRHRKLCAGVGTTAVSTWKRTTRSYLPLFLKGRKSFIIDQGKNLFVARIGVLFFLFGCPQGVPSVTSTPNFFTSTTDMLCQSWAETACGLHVTATAWFPHAAVSLCKTEEEQAEIMKYRNLWKRGSFRKKACQTEIPRIMEKWQKGKHGKGIVKQPVTETFFFKIVLLSLRVTKGT